MKEEWKEQGFDVCHRRDGKLIRNHEVFVQQNKKFEATIDGNHSFNIATRQWTRFPPADQPRPLQCPLRLSNERDSACKLAEPSSHQFDDDFAEGATVEMIKCNW